MLLKSEVTLSGLDFRDPAGSGSGRARPTVGIIPRGDYEPRPATKHRPAHPDVYGFPSLVAPAAMTDLIKYVLGEFASVAGGSTLSHNRLILTCHSGGGDWLGAILQHFDPDEIHLFDAIYGVPQPLLTLGSAVIWQPTMGELRLETARFGCSLRTVIQRHHMPRRLPKPFMRRWATPSTLKCLCPILG